MEIRRGAHSHYPASPNTLRRSQCRQSSWVAVKPLRRQQLGLGGRRDERVTMDVRFGERWADTHRFDLPQEHRSSCTTSSDEASLAEPVRVEDVKRIHLHLRVEGDVGDGRGSGLDEGLRELMRATLRRASWVGERDWLERTFADCNCLVDDVLFGLRGAPDGSRLRSRSQKELSMECLIFRRSSLRTNAIREEGNGVFVDGPHAKVFQVRVERVLCTFRTFALPILRMLFVHVRAYFCSLHYELGRVDIGEVYDQQ